MAEVPFTPIRPLPTPIPVALDGGGMAAAESTLHELRVRIPVELHRQLLSLKVLRGKSLAETVSQALDLYFAEEARSAAGSAE